MTWRRFSRWARERRRRPVPGVPDGADPRYRCLACRSWNVTADETRPRVGFALTLFPVECDECGLQFEA